MMSKSLPVEPNRGGLLTARGLYFGYYMALGALSPYINLYYERKGLSGMRIGLLSGLMLLTTSVSAIGWGGIADRLHLHRRMLTINLVLALICVFLMSRANSFPVLIPVVIAYAFFVAPVVPLLDSSALEVAKRRARSFGEIRVGGSVGWIVSVTLVGFLIEALNIRWLFYTCIASIALTTIFSLWQPDREQDLHSPWSANLRALLKDPSILLFLTSIFLVAVGSAAAGSFFSLYMDGIGAGAGMIGIAWAVASMSEIPVMIYAAQMMQRIGTSGLLKLSFAVYALRWLLLSFIHDPLWTLAVQLLHGLSFAAFLTAGVTYLNERTPAGFSTTSQAVFNVVSYGLAAVAGSLAGGYLYDHGGMPVLFRVFSFVTAAGLVVFWIGSARPWRIAYASNL